MEDHRRRCRLAALVATALCLVAAHEGRTGAAARPLHAAEERTPMEAELVVAAEAPEGARWPSAGAAGGRDALGEGKWLPFPMPMSMPLTMPAAASALAGGLRFPPLFVPGGASPSISMPWLPGAPPAFATTGPGGGLPSLVPPYVGATRQEQLSLWASLFNPLQVRPRLPGPHGAGEAVAGPGERGGVPGAIASGGKAAAAEGETIDVPAAGAVQVAEPKWGVFLGNIDHRP